MLRTHATRASLALICALATLNACGTTDDGDKADAAGIDVTYTDAGQFLPAKPSTSVCNPCNSSAQCGGDSDKDAVCVSYGDDGSFCGTGCASDGDCTEGYTCASVKSVEGADSKQCVFKKGASDKGPYGQCPCSAWAAAKSLSTSCKSDAAKGCSAARYCTSGGLSTCEPVAKPGDKEVCDGIDNNCDGQIDENTCKDAPECQAGVCHPANGCIYSPAPGACDDGSKCTKDDKCFDGACTGSDISCDDSNPCTKDTCDKTNGCVHVPLANGQTCDDGAPCTVGDACTDGKCASGADKTTVTVKAGGCLDDNPCTEDLCQKTSGACINVVSEGLACDDGDACTDKDACDKSGNCQSGKAKDCSDGKDCTTDSCDKDKGCLNLPSATTPCGT